MPKVERICQYKECQKVFYAYPCHIKSGFAIYCSRMCKCLASRVKVERICALPSCGNTYSTWPKRLEGGGGYYCCGACSNAARRGANSPTWTGSDIGISGAHARCRKLWGSASQYPCIECGKQARDWAYDGTDPDQRYTNKRGVYVFYSAWPEFYMPMCRKCHRKRDSEIASYELREYRWFKQIFGRTTATDMLAAYLDARGL